jgi:hypothetical protein
MKEEKEKGFCTILARKSLKRSGCSRFLEDDVTNPRRSSYALTKHGDV